MTFGFETGVGLFLLAIGLGMGRWASRYDVKSWLTDAVWRFIFRRGWRDARRAPIQDVIDGDGELRRQFSEKADAFKADAGRIGHTRAFAKHGVLFAIASAVNFVAGIVMIAGLLLLAHAAYRWLA